MSFVPNIRALLRSAFTAFLLGVLVSCGASPVGSSEGRVYHCIATDHPIPPPNTWAKKTPLERFEYGDYRDEDRPTISGSGYCAVLAVPKTAYLRYRVDGRLIEKRFDLSALTPDRVKNKTVQFLVDGDTVEVRLLAPVPGRYVDNVEVIQRQ
jgi:hypothetical protein